MLEKKSKVEVEVFINNYNFALNEEFDYLDKNEDADFFKNQNKTKQETSQGKEISTK